jgi:Carbohydrate esterase, sialic acid-specific acetylesterase
MATSKRCLVALLLGVLFVTAARAQSDDSVVRVFIFAGQSNMVGADSRVADVERFPPFADATKEQPKVRFWYVIGREDKQRSKGWVALQPISDMVGPELTFAREVQRHTKAPLAIVKVAAGGTTLGTDWNPDQPSGFELYPLALTTVREALKELDRKRVKWRLEGFVWHQGENDMFDEAFRKNYEANLANFIACWRRDLSAPQLRFFIGELCTKTVWGMDNRVPMHGIEVAQRAVAEKDPLVDYVATSHIGVEIGGGEGLHYHYGTLGQLEHGVNHAHAYLRAIDAWKPPARPLQRWPYAAGAPIDLYVLVGHRNMEGERAFVQQLTSLSKGRELAKNQDGIAYGYATGGGVHRSTEFEPLGPAGLYDTFGPELSFGHALTKGRHAPFALAKFTQSGAQIVDFTPGGSEATTRNLYPAWLEFVRSTITALEQKGHTVRLAGIVYHLGENDMAWNPHRQKAATWLGEWIAASRRDLALPQLRWFVSQQAPPKLGGKENDDVIDAVRKLAAADPHLVHVEVLKPPPQREALVFDTAGVVWLGEQLAAAVLRASK